MILAEGYWTFNRWPLASSSLVHCSHSTRLQHAERCTRTRQHFECGSSPAGVVGSVVVGVLLTCMAFWCFMAACITGFMCAGAGFGNSPARAQPSLDPQPDQNSTSLRLPAEQ